MNVFAIDRVLKCVLCDESPLTASRDAPLLHVALARTSFSFISVANCSAKHSTMTLQWTVVAVFLYAEIGFLALLLLPWIRPHM